jgi:hypothetical protein
MRAQDADIPLCFRANGMLVLFGTPLCQRDAAQPAAERCNCSPILDLVCCEQKPDSSRNSFKHDLFVAVGFEKECIWDEAQGNSLSQSKRRRKKEESKSDPLVFHPRPFLPAFFPHLFPCSLQ